MQTVFIQAELLSHVKMKQNISLLFNLYKYGLVVFILMLCLDLII